MDPDSLADRSSITTTLLLTLFAINITASAELPRISYATFMDRYHYAMVLFIVATIIENVIAANHDAIGYSAEAIDRVGFAVLIACFVFIHLYLFFFSKCY
jgi:hypothetical protein